MQPAPRLRRRVRMRLALPRGRALEQRHALPVRRAPAGAAPGCAATPFTRTAGATPSQAGGRARVFAMSPSLVRSRKHLQSSRFASGGGQTVLFRWGHKGIGRGTVQGGGGWRGGDGAQVSGQVRVGLLGRHDKALRAARLNTPGTCLFPLPSRSLGPRNRYPGVRRAALSLQVLRRARPRLARLPVTAEGLAARPSPPPSHTAAPLPLCL